MKIDEYYRNVARINLNGSILALIPAILIVGTNFVIFQNKQVMLFVIPFLLYSFINFQLYIRKMQQAFIIGKNLPESKLSAISFFSSEQYLLYFYNTLSPRLMIFFPDGNLAGEIKKYREKGQMLEGFSKTFALYDFNKEIICFFGIIGKKHMKIEVFNQDHVYLGCLEKSNQFFVKKHKRELLNGDGRFIAAIEGSPLYMDEQIVDSYNLQIGRLQRGWMPVEWNSYILDPNTPVLSLSNEILEKDKFLQLSFLIDEFFIKR
jgi:hypothetical protein